MTNGEEKTGKLIGIELGDGEAASRWCGNLVGEKKISRGEFSIIVATEIMGIIICWEKDSAGRREDDFERSFRRKNWKSATLALARQSRVSSGTDGTIRACYPCNLPSFPWFLSFVTRDPDSHIPAGADDDTGVIVV